ncbi:hypothetical protein CLOM_g10852 [Closterium sp. NIES-68]|nr:hypothetical protein CLOM_g10852 [Closterium sp. NIES-68]
MWELRCEVQKQVVQLSSSTRGSARPNHSSTCSNVTSNETASLEVRSRTSSSNDSSGVNCNDGVTDVSCYSDSNDSNDNEVSCSEKAEVSSAADSNYISSVIPLSDTSSVVSDVSCCDNTSDEVSVVNSSDAGSSGVSSTSDVTSPNLTTVEVPVVNATSRTTKSAVSSKSRAARAAIASARLLPSLIPKPRAIVRVAPAVEQPCDGMLDAVSQPAVTESSKARLHQEKKSNTGCRGRQSARTTRGAAERPHWRP